MTPSCHTCLHHYPDDEPCQTCPDYENYSPDPELDDNEPDDGMNEADRRNDEEKMRNI